MGESLGVHLNGWKNENDVFAFYVAQFVQSLAEGLSEVHAFRDRAGRKNTYSRNFRRLLRLRELE
jgi:hypothetical protein